MRVVLINYAYDAAITDPDALLDRDRTTTGWAEAVLEAGAGAVVVFRRFARDADRERRGVRYVLRRDDGGPMAESRTHPRALHEIAVASRPDLAHVDGLMFPWQLRQLRALLPAACPIVVQDHAGADPAPIAWWRVRARRRRRATRDGLPVVDAFLFTSVEQGHAWQDVGVIARDQPIHDVVESSTALRPVAREAARRASGVGGSPAILWVGRLNANKDPLTVLDGFERAVSALPDARLSMIYTEAPLIARVRERLQRSPILTERTRLCGAVPHAELAACYSAADIFVLGSHHEGSGYALIESLACGCVPVVTDIPSFRAITANGESGALWRPGDGAACAAALVGVARSDLAVRRSAIRAHFERHLSWSAIGRRAFAIYKEVVDVRRAATRP